MAVLAVLAASPRGQLALHTSGSSGTTLEATRCAATPPRSTASGCHHTLTTTHFVLAFALCLGGLVRLALSRIADCCARRRLGQRRALLGRRPCASQRAEKGRAEPLAASQLAGDFAGGLDRETRAFRLRIRAPTSGQPLGGFGPRVQRWIGAMS